MINRIIRFSIYNKLIIGLLIAALIGWGVYSLQHLPIDAVPDITDNQVQVITNAPSLAAQEVEQLITYPLEMALGNIPGVVEIRSVSRFGLSLITVVFEESMDIYLARQLISERIRQAESEIPREFGQPEMGPITTGLGEIYQYVIFAAEGFEDQYTSTELRSIQDWVIKRQLTGIDGVVEINSSGGHLKQYEVAFNPDNLRSMGVTIGELVEALSENNANTGGSYIEKKHYTYFIRGEGRLNSLEDIGNVVVKNVNGFPILVKHVAKVKFGHAPRFGAVTMNGKGEVVAGQVIMLKGANSAEVTERVKTRMEKIIKSLPEGVVVEPYLDRTKLVNRTTKTVITNLVEGGLIVIFVLVLLLGNLRAGLIVASVIPLSMLFAISMMRIFGISANLMSLGAIDFGLVVDGAVIIVEAILYHLGNRNASARLSVNEMNEEVYESASRIRKSAAFGEIIILIVYIPILLLTGIEGKMFRPMAMTVSFAILGALILSLTYVPMMSSLFLSKNISHKKNIADRIVGAIHSFYVPVLKFSMKMKAIVLVGTILLFGFSLWIFSRMGGEFIPTLEEGDFALHQILPPGSSIAQGVEVSAALQKILLEKFPEVIKVVTKIGTAEIPIDVMPIEAGDIYVILKPKEEWTSAATREELFDKMEAELNKFPGVVYEFTQPIQMRFNELMTGVRQDIAIKIYGEDPGLLVNIAKRAEGLIGQIDGSGDIRVEQTTGLQQMVAKYDRSKMAKYGVSAGTINEAIKTGFAGAQAGFIFEGEKRFDLVVRLDEPFRQDIDNLKNIYVTLANGDQIPLQELAYIGYEEGPTQISRDNTQRRITIGVNARGRDVESLVGAIQQKLDDELDLPSGYYLTYGGAFENLRDARNRLMIAVPAALALIFALLYFTFNSVKQSLLIFTAIPMSVIGGIWALYFRDMPFSISAGVGFIALFGVAVLNGIVLIAYFNRLKKEGIADVNQRIFKGTEVRLRPVIMTASVASLGFLPMATSTSAGAEVQQPLATVVIGGLITATFLTLVVLPILYYYSEKSWKLKFKSAGIGLLLLFIGLPLFGQLPKVSLEQAIAIGQKNYPALKSGQLQVEQAQKLSTIKATHPNAAFYVSGEEIDFGALSGVHSLGIQQNFNFPKVSRSMQKVNRQQAVLASKQLELSGQELAFEISLAYYDLLYRKERMSLARSLVDIYEELVAISENRLRAGETGKLPLMTARDQLNAAQWQLQLWEQEQQLAHTVFNDWLRADTLFDPELEQLPPPSETAEQNLQNHPEVQYLRQSEQLALAQVEAAKYQFAPQLQTGVQLQTIHGQFPAYGYQLGISAPLFKKSQKTRVEAAQVEVLVQQSNTEAAISDLEIQQKQLELAMQKELNSIRYLEDQLMPAVLERQAIAKEAFLNGEATYLEYVFSIEQGIQYRTAYLEALRNYHLLKTKHFYLF